MSEEAYTRWLRHRLVGGPNILWYLLKYGRKEGQKRYQKVALKYDMKNRRLWRAVEKERRRGNHD